jgi:hypothetical protein
MDQYELLGREVAKIDISKLLSVFYGEVHEDYFPLLKAESDKEEKEAEDEEDMVMKEMVERIPPPKDTEFPQKIADNVRGSITDAILFIVTDVLRDFMHGRREGEFHGWEDMESPYMLFMRGGAQIVDPDAKIKLNETIRELGSEIASYAYESATYAGRKTIYSADVDMAARRLKKRVNITQEDLRNLIRDELARLK